jgi:hypothetical protein
MSKKMTIAEQLLSIADNPKYNLSDEDKAFLVERADKASRKSNGEKKPTAKQLANITVADKVYEFMADTPDTQYTVSELLKVVPEFDGCSASYANAIIKKLKDGGRVVRTEIKGRAYFKAVV